jgi:hypothetical protein
MLPAFLISSENEMPPANDQILFGTYLGGFDQMLADLRFQMQGNGRNVSEHRDELMGQMWGKINLIFLMPFIFEEGKSIFWCNLFSFG